MRTKTLWLASLLILGSLLLSACGGQNGAPASPEEAARLRQGELVFQANCAACHSTEFETTIVGPSLIGLASRAGQVISGMDARAYLTQSILEPGAFINEGFQNLMPQTYASSLSEDDLSALVDYLMTFE